MKNKLKVILNAHDSSAEILLYGPVGDSFFEEGISDVDIAKSLNLMKSIENIKVRINSPGGDVFQGLAIYNSLLNHPAKIDIEIDGGALSIASVIAMAGDTITMAASSLFMIHNPMTFAVGDAEELRKTADTMDKAKETLVNAYLTQSNLTKKGISNAMDAETWFTPKEAKEAGFITDITKAQKVTAKFDLKKYNFKNAPSILGEVTPADMEDMETSGGWVIPGDDTDETIEVQENPDKAEQVFNRNKILMRQIELAEMSV